MFDVYNWDFDGYCAEQLARVWDLPDDFASLGPRGGSLVERLKRELVGGLRFMASLDRSDAFWKDRNHLPMTSKLAELARMQLKGPSPDAAFAWYDLAIGVQGWSCHLPAAAVWKLESPARIETRWLVEAGYLESAFWGPDAESMRPVARTLGRLAEYDAGVRSLASARDPAVRSWAAGEGGMTGR